MPQTILGIDIGSYSIKIAEIERSFKAFTFVNFYERKVQYNELLKPEESLAVTLQGMIDDFGLHWDQVLVAYPGQRVSCRPITLPFGNVKKIDQTLEFELEGYIPFDLENLVMDYHVVHGTKESSDVLVFYTLKEEFAKWLAFLQSSRLEPRVITCETVDYLNLIQLGMTAPEAPYAVIDIGHRKTNVAICKGKNFGYFRAISIAGEALTRAIHKKVGVPLEEAERMKIEMGGISEEGEEPLDDLTRQVHGAIQETLEELMVNLKQVLFAYRSREQEAVGAIYLCGGTSRLPGLDRYISSRLKLNTAFIQPNTFYFTNLGKVQSHPSVMSQALSLALRSVAPARMPDINFRQGEFVFKADMEKIGGTFRHAGVALGLILLLGLGYFGIKYTLFSGELAAMNQKVTEPLRQVFPAAKKGALETPEKGLKFIEAEKRKLKTLTDALSEVQGRPVIDMLKEISAVLPGREELPIDVDWLDIRPEQIKMKGVAESSTAVSQIQEAMKKLKWVEKIDPPQARRGAKENEWKFDLSMDLVVEKKKKGKGKKR